MNNPPSKSKNLTAEGYANYPAHYSPVAFARSGEPGGNSLNGANSGPSSPSPNPQLVSYLSWLGERLRKGLEVLQLQPKILLSDPATGKEKLRSVRPVLAECYLEVTQPHHAAVLTCYLDNLSEWQAIQPAPASYTAKNASAHLSRWLGKPIYVFSTTDKGGASRIGLSIALDGDPLKLLPLSQRPPTATITAQPSQVRSAARTDGATTTNNTNAMNTRVAGGGSGLAQTRGPGPGREGNESSLPFKVDFFNYVNLSQHLRHQNSSLIPKICFGMSQQGTALYHSFKELNHLLISGATDSGKSTLALSLLAQVLLGEVFATSSTPTQVALVDPGRVSFNPQLFEGLPQLVGGQVMSSREQVEWLLEKLEHERFRRAHYFNQAKGYPDNLDDYNRAVSDKYRLGALVVFIEEINVLAKMMGKRLLEPLIRLLWDTRKYGIYFVLAGQNIHARNLPTEIRDGCASRVALGNLSDDSLRMLQIEPALYSLGRRAQGAIKGRGLLNLGGGSQVLTFQGLYLSKTDFITQVNVLRQRAGLAQAGHGQEEDSPQWEPKPELTFPGDSPHPQTGKGNTNTKPEPEAGMTTPTPPSPPPSASVRISAGGPKGQPQPQPLLLNEKEQQEQVLAVLTQQPGMAVRELQRVMLDRYQVRPSTTFNRLERLRAMGLVKGTTPVTQAA